MSALVYEYFTDAKSCLFSSVSAELYRAELIRHAFTDGLLSTHIQQRNTRKQHLDITTSLTTKPLNLAEENAKNYDTVAATSEISPPICTLRPRMKH